MAEYIDRDIAIRTAIEMCVKVVGHGITQFDAAEIANAFEDIPAADVVPKSEVEELQTEIEELQAKVARLRNENIKLLVSKETDIHISMEKLVKVRTEHPIFKAIEEKVAREIFDDIANMMVLQHGFNEKHIVAHIDFELLKELKKKYTENME